MKPISFNQPHPLMIRKQYSIDWGSTKLLMMSGIAELVRYAVENLLLSTLDLE